MVVCAIADYSEAIRLDPQSVYARHDRAIVYAERGDLQRALSDLDEAVRVAPKDPRPRELRGCIRVKCGDYESGLADLCAAVVLNPTDPAGKFEAWPKRRLTAEAIRFGEEQVQKMLRDRPAMVQYGGKSDVVCRWAACKFAGEDVGMTIHWDSSDPTVLDADSGMTTSESFAHIRLREKYDDGEKKGKRGRPRSSGVVPFSSFTIWRAGRKRSGYERRLAPDV